MANPIIATFVDGPRAGQVSEEKDAFFFTSRDGRLIFGKYRWEKWPSVLMADLWESEPMNDDPRCREFKMKFVDTSRFDGGI